MTAIAQIPGKQKCKHAILRFSTICKMACCHLKVDDDKGKQYTINLKGTMKIINSNKLTK